jgi:hypothetical protein
MLPTLGTQLSSASKKIAKKDSPEWTHIQDIKEVIKRTLDVSLANTAGNTEERMASNVVIILPSIFGTTTISRMTRTKRVPYTTASGAQR